MIKFLICLLVPVTIAFSHSGGTDSNGGHHDRINGGYHFHHGRGPHQHSGGVCPYENGDGWGAKPWLIVGGIIIWLYLQKKDD